MQREQAKQFLELCRPGHRSDPQDPALADAFALLEKDAELREWWDAQQAIDSRISDSLNSIQAPDSLKDEILAGMQLHEGQSAAMPKEPITREAAWWRHPWTGIAAVFAVLLGIMIFPAEQNTTTSSEISAGSVAGIPPILEFLSREIDGLSSRGFDQRGEDAETLKAYLAGHQSPAPETIPNYLQSIPTVGCVTFEFKEVPLSMICFKNGAVYHLTTVSKSTYPCILPREPTVYEGPDKAFKIWIDGDQVKILTIHGPKEDIPELI